MLYVPESLKPYSLLAPAADAAGRTSAVYVSLKNVHRAWIVVHLDQGNAATVLLAPKKATAVAGTGTTAITTAVPIWSSQDQAASDTFTRETDAVNFTTSAAVKHKVVIFQIDPATLGAYDCIGLTTGASNAANITSALVLCEMRYESANPPSVITD